MTRNELIRHLRREIAARLTGLVDQDYVLMGLPYYLNIGDILIWEGIRQYLETLPYKCRNAGYRYREEGRIREDTLILLQGGGNFGDLWRWIQDERLAILRRHPKNPALLFPVSCCYENVELLRQDAAELAAYPNLTICARDNASYELLVQNFKNRILLVPDMAFFIEPEPLRGTKVVRGRLYLKRTDKELAAGQGPMPPAPPDGLTTADWPCLEREPWHWLWYKRILGWGRHARGKRGVWRISDQVIQLSDLFYHHICRRFLIRQGASFIGRYREIVTTRLHAAILAILMDKSVLLVDDANGKISGFYRTWLNGVDGVKLSD